MAACGLALLGSAGCQKLDSERSIHLDAGEVQIIRIGPPRSDQKVTVVVDSPRSSINVYLVLEQDQEEAKQALLLDRKLPQLPLAGKEKTNSATLEATVPARNGFAVMLSGAEKATDVKLKVTGR